MKAITRPELRAIELLDVAINTLVTEFSGTKTQADFGYMDRAKAEKMVVRRALGINRRGYP